MSMNVTSTGIAVALAVVVAMSLLVFGPGIFNPFTSTAQGQFMEAPLAENKATMSEPIPNPLPTELTVTDTVMGAGAEAKAGDQVSVKYVGMLADGTVFDASERHGDQPFVFMLGNGDVIQGWDQGIAGMKVGGKRRLIIPPSLAYGERDLGIIPANSTLIFDVELLAVNGQ